MVLDTNVLVSALISPGGPADQLLQRWEGDEFTLVTSADQLDEVERVFAYEKLQRFIRPDQAARLVTNLRRSAVFAETLPSVEASSDASDNVILATAMAGNASHLITGDRGDLLGLKRVEEVSIIAVREAIELLDALARGS
jgi:hypothetical protein